MALAYFRVGNHILPALPQQNLGQRIIEKIVEGPSLLGHVRDPDSIDGGSPTSFDLMRSGSVASMSEIASVASGALDCLTELYSAMEADHFFMVIYNIIIGNQVIVRGAEVSSRHEIY